MAVVAEGFVVRVARDDAELAKAYGLRYDVYVEELGIYGRFADHERRILTDATDEGSDVLVALAGEEVVGTARITAGARRALPEWMRHDYDLERFAGVVPEARMCVVTRLMVRRDFRGSLVPVELMAAMVRIAVELDVDLMFADCEPHLLAMYTLLGFRPYCGTFSDENGDLSVPLVCLARDHAHFRALGSPALSWGAEQLDPAGGAATPEQILACCDLRPPVEPVAKEVVSQLDDLGGVFEGLESEEVAALLERSHVIAIDAGAPLIRAGQRRRNVYVVLDGSVQVGSTGRTVGPGETVGEVALLTGRERMMHVVAGPEGTRVLTLSERTLKRLIESQSRTAAVLMYNLARLLASRLAGSASDS